MITAKAIEADPLATDDHQVIAMTLADVRDILAKLVSPEAKLQISAIICGGEQDLTEPGAEKHRCIACSRTSC